MLLIPSFSKYTIKNSLLFPYNKRRYCKFSDSIYCYTSPLCHKKGAYMKNISIRGKILIISIGSLIVLGLIISSVAVFKTQNALIKQSYSKLITVRNNKKNQIDTFFEKTISDIKVLSTSEDLQAFTKELLSVNSMLDLKVDALFPTEEFLVQDATESREKFFQNYAKEYGYQDIFIISKESGRVLYTQAKNSDYGENLKYGVLEKSGLAQMWAKTVDSKQSTFADMQTYKPKANEPTMFVGTPIIKDGIFIAVLAFEISDATINKIMTSREGFGKTEEAYLVGSDFLMRSNRILDMKHRSVKNSFINPKEGSISNMVVKNSLKGKVGMSVIKDEYEESILSSFSSIKIGQDITWSIIAQINEDEVMIVPHNIRNTILLISFVLLLFVAFFVKLFINKGVIHPMEKNNEGLLNFFKYINKESLSVELLDENRADEMGKMAKVVNVNIKKIQSNLESEKNLIEDASLILTQVNEGYLTKRIQSQSNNEGLNELKNLMNNMLDVLNKNVSGILNVLNEYSNYNYLSQVDKADTKGEMAQLGDDINNLGEAITKMLVANKQNGLVLKEGANTLLENVNTLNSSSNEAAASLEETAAALEEITGTIVNNTNNISQMQTYSKELITSIKAGENLANSTATAMDEINLQTNAIAQAITVIDQISFQTNILSLNAAVEAATAGEAGKGFAVVAQEVRNLASRSADAAKEIKELVENATAKTDSGKQIADKMIKGYQELNSNMVKTSETIIDISNASKEQQAGIEQINSTINNLDQQTQLNASSASEAKSVAIKTNEMAETIVTEANSKEFRGKDFVESKSEQKHKNQNQMCIGDELNKSCEKIEVNTANIPNFETNDSDESWKNF